MRLPATASPPAFWHVPEGSIFTIADEVTDLMEAIGYQVDEPERLAVRALLPQKRNGDWAGLQSAIIAARQNIKTASMIACAVHDTFEQGLDVVWTAHEFKTSADAFKDFQAIIEGDESLAGDVLRVRTSNGKEGFDLRNGATLRIIARSGRSGRGFSKVPRLYGDEGLYLDAKMLGAITPTMGAIRNAHFVIGSSPGILTSEVLRDIRRRGRSGEDPDLGYVEWTSDRLACAREGCGHAPGTEGCQLDNEYLWWQANPALGRRISVDFLRGQRKVLAAAIPEFMREHMGWWEDPPTFEESSAFPVEEWDARCDPGSVVPDDARVGFGIDTSWDRRTTWLAIAATRADGTPHVELLSGHGVPDLAIADVRSLLSRWDAAGIGVQESGAPASSLAPPLQQAFDPGGGEPIVRVLGSQDLGRACAGLWDAIKHGPLAHIGQEQLETAIRKAAVRPLGDAWVIDRKRSEVDVAPLMAAAIALHVLKTYGGDTAPNIW